jgi:type II secretory pathway component GspD/PulD (secretin)
MLVLLNIHFGVGAASNGKIVKLLSIGVSEQTKEHLIMRIKATGPVQYQNAVLYEISEKTIIFYVDMPNSYNYIDSSGSVTITPPLPPSNLSVDVPVIKIKTSQFSLNPSISRVVFYLKKPIEPTITAENNSLLFTFPISPKEATNEAVRTEERQPESPVEVKQIESPAEVKQTEAKEKPVVITQVKLIFEPKETKLCIISDKQLNFKQVVSDKKLPDTDIEAILELDFVNATSNLSTEIPVQQKSVIRKITLDTEIGPPPSCKIIIQLAKRVFYDISNIDGELQVSFENPLLDRIVTIKSDNESLSLLLLTLFKQYNANIIVDKDVDVSQQVTFNLENVPLKVALDEILGSLGYKYEEVSGGILRIVPVEPQPEVSKEIVKPEKLETKSFTLRYASVSKLREVLQTLISKDGKIIDDERTKSIIIMDTPESLAALGDTLDKIVSELDKEVPEEEKSVEQPALPEKKIVKRVIKLNYANPEELKNILTPLLSPDGEIEAPEKSTSGTGRAGGAGTVGRSGGTGGAGGAGVSAGVEYGGYLIVTDIPEIVSQIEREISKLDLPIPQVEIQAYIIEGTLSDEIEAGMNWAQMRDKKTELAADALSTEGTLRLSYGNLPAEKFTAVLTALSNRSDTKLLSCPRIIVLENNQANFHSGDQIGFSKVTIQEGIQTVETVFTDVGIELTTSPQIKPGDIISLWVNVQVRDLGELTKTGQPTISDRSAQTQLLVHDGDTTVIGGLTSNRILENVKKVPLLGNIPLLGRLFSYKNNIKKKTEITLFITPRIVKTETENQSGIE